MSSRSPTLAEVLQGVVDKAKAELRVALPARVESYDPSTQTVSVKPLLRDASPLEDGTVDPVSLPVIPRVPVVFPGAGGFRLTLPITPGDTVLLVFSDRSLDKWKAYGGEVDPVALQRHDLADAIAIPGLHPSTAAGSWTGASGGDMTLGKDGGPQVKLSATDVQLGAGAAPATEAVIRGTTYRTAEDALLRALDTFLGAIVAGVAGTPASLAPAAAAWATARTAFAVAVSTALSSVVKTE